MKILEITFLPPAKNKGGGYMGIYQSIKSLSEFAWVDYIGPEFDRTLFSRHVKIKKILKPDQYSIRRICRLIKGITTSYYQSWISIKDNIRWEEYDAVYIDSSRYFFLADEAKKHGVRVVIRFHNIEKDYTQRLFQNQKSLSAFMQYVMFSIGEKKVSMSADKFVFLTKEDAKRAVELYQIPKKKMNIVPVCFESPLHCKEDNVMKNQSDSCILITGTLNFAPNESGIIWFLTYVWDALKAAIPEKQLKLVIAGFSAGSRLKQLCEKHQLVELIDSPPDMRPYFEMADVYAAPVFYGAGMKVKAAEALSYGIPTAGTSHVWIGYEALRYGKIIADTPKAFVFGIRDILLMDAAEKKKLKREILDDFQLNYSMEASAGKFRKIFDFL